MFIRTLSIQLIFDLITYKVLDILQQHLLLFLVILMDTKTSSPRHILHPLVHCVMHVWKASNIGAQSIKWVVGEQQKDCSEFKCSMKREFEMTALGELKFFLGIEILQKSGGIFICQRKYAAEVLKRFGMEESNSVTNPIVPGQKMCSNENGVKADATLFKQIVGSLMYLTATRPDLMFVVCLISRYMGNPTQLHFCSC